MWSLNEDFLNLARDIREVNEDSLVDRDAVFLELLRKEYEFHIDRIGFNFKNRKIIKIPKNHKDKLR